MERIYDLIILGGGPAGYSAALYGARGGMNVLVVEKLAPGGQMNQTARIDNYPGLDQGIDGVELGQRMASGARRFGAKTVFAQVQEAWLRENPKRIRTNKGEFLASAVVIATGAEHKRLGISKEAEFFGRGIAYCAVCDGMFYKGKTVAVIGGGNSAVVDALVLARLCEKVILVHRRDTLRAEKVYQDQLFAMKNVEFRWNSSVRELLGEASITGLCLQDTKTEELSTIQVDGVFVGIGREPQSRLFREQLELDDGGYIIADESTRTAIAGVFAAGDVRAKPVRQVVTAVADGAVAAHYAQEYLAGG